MRSTIGEYLKLCDATFCFELCELSSLLSRDRICFLHTFSLLGRKLLQAEASRTPRNVLTRLRAIQKIVEARRSLTSPLIPPSKSLPSNCSSDPLPQFIPLHVPKEDDTKPGQKVEPLVVPTQLKPEAKREAIAAPSRPPGASLASPPMSPPHLLVPRPAQCSSETPRGVNKWCWCGYCRSPVSNWAEHLSTERHIAVRCSSLRLLFTDVGG